MLNLKFLLKTPHKPRLIAKQNVYPLKVNVKLTKAFVSIRLAASVQCKLWIAIQLLPESAFS